MEHFVALIGQCLGTSGAPATIHLSMMIALIFLAAILVTGSEASASAA
jgi:hypothetical protein